MPPASRAFFLFLSNINHTRPPPQCIRLHLQAPSRHLQRRYNSNIPSPPKHKAPAPPQPRPSPNARARNHPPPERTPNPSRPERTKYGIPLSQWTQLPPLTRLHHHLQALYATKFGTTFLRADRDQYARRPLYAYILLLPPLLFFYTHWPFQFFHVRGDSMFPTLSEDDEERRALVVQLWSINDRKIAARKAAEGERDFGVGRFERGVVVVYWCPHREGDRVAVKRVVGLPGDRVRPLGRERRKDEIEGDSEEEDSVIVPYNHVWVEGDIGDYEKSVDSNWFGPISQELVIGKAVLVGSAWWKPWSFRRVDWTADSWPAREQGRVDENVAWKSAVDPLAMKKLEAFDNGKLEMMTDWVRARPETVYENLVQNGKVAGTYKDVYQMCARVLLSPQSNPEHKRKAKDLVMAFEVIAPRDVWLGKQSVNEKPVRQRGVPMEKSISEAAARPREVPVDQQPVFDPPVKQRSPPKLPDKHALLKIDD